MGTIRRLLTAALPVMLLLTALAVWSAPAASAASTPLRLRALAWAEAHAGAPYVWGGTGPWGFDCSGLVWAAYRAAGVTLPRTTYGMLASGRVRWIPASQRQRGDLAFYGSGHVELVTRSGTFGAKDFGTLVGWHHPSGWWQPTEYARVL